MESRSSSEHMSVEHAAMTALPKMVVVCGPTGVGKTTAAIAIARRFNAEIISADSMQIYRHMDIGSAKPTPAEQAAAVHHMIDIVDPDEAFDAAQFERRALPSIEQLHAAQRLPLVVGGTGLYIKALLHGLTEAHKGDPRRREQLKACERRHGAGHLHRQLTAVDPDSAARIHPNDLFRIIRALETYEITGKPMSWHQRSHQFQIQRFDTLKLGLTLPRADLYARIDQRVDAMLSAGLLEEVRALLAAGYDGQLKSMQSIGYRHMVDFLADAVDWEETVRLLKRDTRRYAKRQMTWFGADDQVCWMTPDDVDAMRVKIDRFMSGALLRIR